MKEINESEKNELDDTVLMVTRSTWLEPGCNLFDALLYNATEY